MTRPTDYIAITGVRENNLKHVSVRIPNTITIRLAQSLPLLLLYLCYQIALQ